MSFTKGVSFHHETNASSQPNITNNISINASNELKGNESIEQVKVEQSCEPSIKEVPNESSVPNENEFLKKVLPCGSGKKYRDCCLVKPNAQFKAMCRKAGFGDRNPEEILK